MKLGILGAGMIVHDLNQIIKELPIEEISILVTSIVKAKDLHVDHIYTDYDSLLNSDIDTIYVALPNSLHYEFSKKALLAGKHVICEKPFTSNEKELLDLIEIANKQNLFLLEAMTVSHMPMFKQLKTQLDNLGEIKIVSLNYSQYSSRYDKFKEGIILPAFDYHLSGGALYDLNVYNIHFLVHLFGEPKNIEYYPNISKGIDTSGILYLDYGNFKAISIGAKDCEAPLKNTIQGDQGCIEIDMPVSRMDQFSFTLNKQERKDYKQEIKHRMYYEFMTFINIIENNEKEYADELLEKSYIASKILTKAREKGGIYFDADKN